MELLPRDSARYLLERLVAEWRRYGRRFAIVRLQLPEDQLAAAVPRLRTALREADVLARWDAGELLVLLPETDGVGAETAADRLRAAVRELPMLAGPAEWAGGSIEGMISRAGWAAARPTAH
jgi:hypothetical protein